LFHFEKLEKHLLLQNGIAAHSWRGLHKEKEREKTGAVFCEALNHSVRIAIIYTTTTTTITAAAPK